MAREPGLSDDALLLKILSVFREAGYEAASLSKLAAAADLKRASLYHRFPGGKEEMASEALAAMHRWVDAKVIGMLRGDGSPADRLNAASRAFGELYASGQEPCLINLFGTPAGAPKSLVEGAQKLVAGLVSAIADVLTDAGLSNDEARARALKGVTMVQGAVVMARTFRDTAPFEAMMTEWADDLLAGTDAEAEDTAPKPPAPPATPKAGPALIDVRSVVAAHLRAKRASSS